MSEALEYEEFIAGLIKDIKRSQRIIDFLDSGPPCTLMGHLGQEHQIDVAFIDETCSLPKLVLIECKLKITALVQSNRQKDVAPQIMPYKTVAYVNHRASWKGALTH